MVLLKKAPVTLIDDCIDKFRLHEVERKRLRLLGGQRASTDGAPVEFLIGGEGDPLSSALNEGTEDTEGAELDDMGRGERISIGWFYGAMREYLIYIYILIYNVMNPNTRAVDVQTFVGRPQQV